MATNTPTTEIGLDLDDNARREDGAAFDVTRAALSCMERWQSNYQSLAVSVQTALLRAGFPPATKAELPGALLDAVTALVGARDRAREMFDDADRAHTRAVEERDALRRENGRLRAMVERAALDGPATAQYPTSRARFATSSRCAGRAAKLAVRRALRVSVS